MNQKHIKFKGDNFRKSEEGSVTLEFTLIYGALLGLVLTIVHFGLLYHVSLSASYFADAGLEALQSDRNIEVDDVIQDLVGDAPLVRDLVTKVEINDEAATVRVSASSPGLIPGLPNRITRLAHGQLERFISEEER